MACHCAHNAFLFSPTREFFTTNHIMYKPSSTRCRPFLLSITNASPSYNTLVSEKELCFLYFKILAVAIAFCDYWLCYSHDLWAVRLLIPTAKFEASKLKVVLLEDQINKYASIIPRTYILSHCDFTANLTLAVSNVIYLEQLRGWYEKDDVVAEWKKVKNEMCLHVHCFVSCPNSFTNLAAEFRYHIFSKEMPLVLKAIHFGDSALFHEHPELLDSTVRVYFHSGLQNYNIMECWGPLKDAMEGKQAEKFQGSIRRDSPEKWRSPKSIFQALFAFLL